MNPNPNRQMDDDDDAAGDETPSASTATSSTTNVTNSSSEGLGGGGRSSMRQRQRVSIHRLNKDRIKHDSMENMRQRHEVPTTTTTTAGSSNGSDAGGGDDSDSYPHNNNNGYSNKKKKKRQSHTASFLRHAHKHPWVEKQSNNLQQHYCQRSAREWMHTFLPCSTWLSTYKWKSTFLQDIIAGLTVGVMIVPQSMSYAKLAGLPVEYGLYSAFLPVYMYGIFGSSRQLAVGPVALISLLLATGLNLLLSSQGITLESHPDTYMDYYTTLAIQTSFLVGLTYILMGLLRLGFVTIFLSHAVISGFTTGAAVIIGMSQLKFFLGYDVLKSDRLHILLQRIIADIDQFNYKTFLVGTLSTLLLVFLKHVGKTYPKFKFVRALGPLTVTILAIVVQVLWDLEALGIPIVGHIPRGLPDVTIPKLTPLGLGGVPGNTGGQDDIDTSQMLLVVISIAIVGFMESIAIAKQLASKHNYEVDSSLELIGLGMANCLGAGFFQGYPITGSFSRSAVNNESGAQSGISGMVTATLVGLVLLFLTPVFEQLPLAVLASIVISGVLGLLDYPEAIYLWKVHKFDFLNWVVACVGTLFLGVEIGLAIAVGVSMLVVIYESAYPHTAVLGRLPGTTVYRNVKQYPKAECYDGLVLVRIDAPIYFANTQNVREKIRKYEERANEQVAERERATAAAAGDDEEDPKGGGGTGAVGVKYVILELSPVSHVDTSALHILHDMHRTYQARNMQLCFCNPSQVVMDRFVSSGLVDEVGKEYFFVSIHDAVDHCLEEMDIEEMEQMMQTASSNNTQDDDDDDDDDVDVDDVKNNSLVDVERAMQDGIFMNPDGSDRGSSNGDIGLNVDDSESGAIEA